MRSNFSFKVFKKNIFCELIFIFYCFFLIIVLLLLLYTQLYWCVHWHAYCTFRITIHYQLSNFLRSFQLTSYISHFFAAHGRLHYRYIHICYCKSSGNECNNEKKHDSHNWNTRRFPSRVCSCCCRRRSSIAGIGNSALTICLCWCHIDLVAGTFRKLTILRV